VTEKRAQAHGFSRGSSEPIREFDTPGRYDGPMRYSSTNKTMFSAKYHLIWCPKYRRKVLVGKVGEHLGVIIREICREHHADILGLEIMPDHIHLLVEVLPSVALSRFIQTLKGRSSRVLRQQFPHLRRTRSLWSPSWFVSTVGGAPLSVVKAYVENQKAA
jgi:putative transposase